MERVAWKLYNYNSTKLILRLFIVSMSLPNLKLGITKTEVADISSFMYGYTTSLHEIWTRQ